MDKVNLKNYRFECQYDAVDMLGGIEHRRFTAGDFLSDIEVKIGDRIAYTSRDANIKGFYLGTVIDMIDIPDKNFSYVRCFNDLEKNPELSFKFEQDVERQMKIIKNAKLKERHFPRLLGITPKKINAGICKIDA
jgi:hypothetical protein